MNVLWVLLLALGALQPLSSGRQHPMHGNQFAYGIDGEPAGQRLLISTDPKQNPPSIQKVGCVYSDQTKHKRTILYRNEVLLSSVPS